MIMMIQNCPYKLETKNRSFHKGGTSLRLEALGVLPRCAMKPKTDQFGREYNAMRYYLSGGDSTICAHPCSRTCPLLVDAAIGNYYRSFTGPCPNCGKIHKRRTPGPVVCRECGLKYYLVGDDGHFERDYKLWNDEVKGD